MNQCLSLSHTHDAMIYQERTFLYLGVFGCESKSKNHSTNDAHDHDDNEKDFDAANLAKKFASESVW